MGCWIVVNGRMVLFIHLVYLQHLLMELQLQPLQFGASVSASAALALVVYHFILSPPLHCDQ